jgi:tripartite-type tricarboxylate transporter receptor subunit TctC
LAWASAARAQETPDFKGETITVVIGFEAAGSYATYGRLFARFLGAHLAGQPTVVVQNMPSGGGLIGANYLYSVARRHRRRRDLN